MTFAVRAIAVVHNDRTDMVDDGWDEIDSTVELVEDVPGEALIGLEAFSHVQLVMLASRATDVPPAPWRRRPRANPAWPDVGVFAQRNKDRPNRILVSIASLQHVTARSIVVRGLDALDATPVLDIKPVFTWGGPRGDLRAAPWSEELGADYF